MTDHLPVKLLGDRVLVALPPVETTQDETTGFTVQGLEQSAGGIFLAKPTDEYNVEVATRGLVVQLGSREGVVTVEDVIEMFTDLAFEAAFEAGNGYDRNGQYVVCDHKELVANMSLRRPAPFDVQVGDCVIFTPSAGDQITIGEITYVILREADILGVVAPTEAAA